MQERPLMFMPKRDGVGAFSPTTYLAIAAHMDDIEIMAIDGILKAQADPESHFSGVVLTDGRGSPRKGAFATVSDQEMVKIRTKEQARAALIGGYSSIQVLGYSSDTLKIPNNEKFIADLVEVISGIEPDVIYTHSLADKHATHVAVCLRVIEALRRGTSKPLKAFIGCEVWRGLDWLPDEDKVLMDVSGKPELQKELLRAHRSQTLGGKNYVKAVMGRRAANATFLDPYATELADSLVYGVDLMPLLETPELEPLEYMRKLTTKFQEEMLGLIERLQ